MADPAKTTAVQEHSSSVETKSIEEIVDEDLRTPLLLEDLEEAWKIIRKKYGPLGILVCGKGGVGKSTLINNLFELKDGQNPAVAGKIGSATTVDVGMYERTTKFGDKIYMFDTPGFGDRGSSHNENLIAKVALATADKKIDLFFYCCLLYTSPSPRDATLSRMPSSA